MPYTQEQHQARQLKRWCKYLGYADFETYLASGGSVIEAVSVLRNLHDSIGMAQAALARFQAPIAADTRPVLGEPVINDLLPHEGDVALAVAEAEATGEHDVEPVDPHNAHVQGDDHVA